MFGSWPSIRSKIQFASSICLGVNCVGKNLQSSRNLLREYLNVYFLVGLLFLLTLYGSCGANAVPSKISIRPQLTQVSSAEPLSKENAPPHS